MSDYDFLDNAVTMMATAAVVNDEFPEVVWVAVDRLAWDKFQQGLHGEINDEMA